jgi:hypothetical protein
MLSHPVGMVGFHPHITPSHAIFEISFDGIRSDNWIPPPRHPNPEVLCWVSNCQILSILNIHVPSPPRRTAAPPTKSIPTGLPIIAPGCRGTRPPGVNVPTAPEPRKGFQSKPHHTPIATPTPTPHRKPHAPPQPTAPPPPTPPRLRQRLRRASLTRGRLVPRQPRAMFSHPVGMVGFPPAPPEP